MKRLVSVAFFTSILLTTSLALGRPVGSTVAPVSQEDVLDVGVFYDDLAPSGEWFELPPYGYVWSPYDMAPGWRPYTNGYWEYTDYGWTWVSNFEWGWAPFHYGRWLLHPSHGWVWVPGTVWGPAWVAWRHGPGFVGWAALPPEIGWRSNALYFDHDFDSYFQPAWFVFVDESHFGDRYMHRYYLHHSRNHEYFRRTWNITRFTFEANRIVNHGIPLYLWERRTGRKILRRRIVDAHSLEHGRGEHVRGNDIVVYRPRIREGRPDRKPPTGRRHDDRGAQRDQGQRNQGQRDRGQRDQGQRNQGQRDRGQRDQGQRNQGQRNQRQPQPGDQGLQNKRNKGDQQGRRDQDAGRQRNQGQRVQRNRQGQQGQREQAQRQQRDQGQKAQKKKDQGQGGKKEKQNKPRRPSGSSASPGSPSVQQEDPSSA